MPARLDLPAIIRATRDGQTLDDATITALVRAYARGKVPDYQMSAWAMAVYHRGLTPRETARLTLAMRDSGRVIRRGKFKAAAVDKHSTGGVGDKVSLALAPWVASVGARVPMIAGRGLAHTGGTIDKLEAIPGYRVDLSPKDFVAQVRTLGTAIIGQTEQVAPADRRLYALRDVTGTVESIPLITGSILSKKLAAGLDALVMDVKVGDGAFMRDEARARELGQSLVRVGREAGLPVRVLLTGMDAPLGRAIGNANETAEAFALLHGEGPDDLVEVTRALAVDMVTLAGYAKTRRAAERALDAALRDGAALALARAWVAAQGGDTRVVDEPDRLQRSRHRAEVRAAKSGRIRRIPALRCGEIALDLGAGRRALGETLDLGAGIDLHVAEGDAVKRDQVIAEVRAKSKKRADAAAAALGQVIAVGRRAVPQKRLLARLGR